jgi:hypothetical protein
LGEQGFNPPTDASVFFTLVITSFTAAVSKLLFCFVVISSEKLLDQVEETWALPFSLFKAIHIPYIQVFINVPHLTV